MYFYSCNLKWQIGVVDFGHSLFRIIDTQDERNAISKENIKLNDCGMFKESCPSYFRREAVKFAGIAHKVL